MLNDYLVKMKGVIAAVTLLLCLVSLTESSSIEHGRLFAIFIFFSISNC